VNQPLTLHKQQGVTLLILAVIMILAFATFAVSRLSINNVKTKKAIKTQAVLKEAKEALMAYVTSYPEAKVSSTVRGPGYFPCPDLADSSGEFDGKSESGCNPAGVVIPGHYPWKTIGTLDFKDTANESLWYAISETFDNTGNPPPDVINVATRGTITLRSGDGFKKNDATSGSGIVAIIIAPGEALRRIDGHAQNRNGDPDNAIEYLDILNGEDNAAFQHNSSNGFIEGDSSANNGFNDSVIAITYNDIMPLIQKRVAAQMKKAVIDFRVNCNVYPEPDVVNNIPELPVDAPQWSGTGCATGRLPEWIKKEEWQNYYRYTKPAPANTSCDDDCIQAL